jgi:hypothetical protein
MSHLPWDDEFRCRCAGEADAIITFSVAAIASIRMQILTAPGQV